MPTDIDNLQIQINANATKANASMDLLVKKIDRLSESLSTIDGHGLRSLANGVQSLGTAMQTMSNVKTTEFTRLAKNLTALNNINVAQLSNVSANVAKIGQSLSGLSGVPQGTQQIVELANGIKQLGYKSADKAITNIPQLAVAMKQLMKELSGAPRVSQNLIDMTNALARLARTGASSGRAAQSLSNSFTGIYKSSGFAVAGLKKVNARLVSLTRSIIPVVGIWQLFNFGKQAVEISSDLTEVQNVVDVTFGEFKQKIEDLADVSIPELGMSELTVKQIGSRFQAMGTAMGFSTEKMSDMSVTLTRLTGDMASFYNVSQEDMGKALQSIFTGETEPMRRYGIDLTNATIQQYALNQGITTSINKMTQLEKAQLRYNYVMAQTAAAQGDFIRTQDTWANQVRILKQNFQQLASIIGGTLINAFKPLIQALNSAMSHIISFAQTVSNALGKIFGWKFEVGGGGVTNDLETGAGAADDIASGMGEAADNAKKLRSHLLAIDELNVYEPTEDSSSGGGSGLGNLGGGSASVGEWVHQDSIWKNFESEIDSLYELGEYIGKVLTDMMNSIDWEKVYEKARNFGTGLADFLNGLISPELFGAVGRTIAGALNTAIYATLAFGERFDWTNLGESIAEGINEFFATFDFADLANTIDVWVQGVWTTLKTAIEEINWEDVWEGIKTFLENIDIETVGIVIGALTIKKILGLHLASTALSMIGKAISRSIAQSIASKLGIEIAANAGIGTALTAGLSKAFTGIGTALTAGVKALFGSSAAEGALAFISPIATAIAGVVSTALGAFAAVASFVSMFTKGFSWIKEIVMVLGAALAAIGAIILGAPALVAGIVAAVVAAVGTIVVVVHDNWDAIKGWFAGIGEWFNATIIEPVGNAFNTLTEKIGGFFSGLWGKITSIWGTVSSWFSTNVIEPVVNFFTGFATRVQQIFEGLWIIIQAVWVVVSEIFNEYIITPITNVITLFIEWITETLTLLWEGIQEIWFTISEVFNEHVVTPLTTLFNAVYTKISEVFTNAWNKVVTIWSKAYNWFNTTVITPVKNAFTVATEAIGNLFSKLWSGIKKGVASAMNAVIGVVESAVNWIIDGINSALTAFNEIVAKASEIIGADWGGVTLVPNISLGRIDISGYELGGFPKQYSLFMAGEHGTAEMLGTIGGKTAVAGGEEITGIREAVIQSSNEEVQLLREQNELLRMLLEKDMSVNIGDREVVESYNRGRARMGYAFT